MAEYNSIQVHQLPSGDRVYHEGNSVRLARGPVAAGLALIVGATACATIDGRMDEPSKPAFDNVTNYDSSGKTDGKFTYTDNTFSTARPALEAEHTNGMAAADALIAETQRFIDDALQTTSTSGISPAATYPVGSNLERIFYHGGKAKLEIAGDDGITYTETAEIPGNCVVYHAGDILRGKPEIGGYIAILAAAMAVIAAKKVRTVYSSIKALFSRPDRGIVRRVAHLDIEPTQIYDLVTVDEDIRIPEDLKPEKFQIDEN